MSTNTALDDIKARAEGHSAAPWKVEPYLMSDGHRVRVTSPDDGPDFNTAEDVRGPDAELIAAAPKLLAALEAVEALHHAAEDYKLPLCNECLDAYPCPTINAIQDALS